MTFCVPLEEVLPPDEDVVGGKARSLLHLARAGWAVPRALVVTSRMFRALRAGAPSLPAALEDDAMLAAALDAQTALATRPWPAGFEAELAAAMERLAPHPDARFSVRSSATLEDRGDALGAGIFLSRTDVPGPHVARAVRDVLASALAPAALAYAARRGLPADALAMAVLVHPFSPGDAGGTAAFDPDAGGTPLLEVGAGAPASLSAPARATIVGAARALATPGRAVELEWVTTGDDVVFLQLRPYLPPVHRPWRWAADLADAPWRWDAAHNPLPLSPAQAGLVALVDARCRAGLRQRVVGGYLFSAPVATTSDAPTAATSARPADAAQALAALTREADARLAALGPEPSLEDVLEVFVAVYEPLYGAVQPAARAARHALEAFLRAHGRPETAGELLRGVPSLATERARRAAAIAATEAPEERVAAVASYLALFGDEAPAWDVAVPTYAEDPALLRGLGPNAAALEAPDPSAAFAAALPAAARAAGAARLAAARSAAAVVEDDDVLYARLQSRVRHALLREGRTLQAANLLARAEDVFWLPLPTLRRHARGEEALTAAGVTHAVARAREANDAALADPPALANASAAEGARAGGVRGSPASGGRAVGRAHLHAPGRPAPAGAILIARTLLPTELPLVSPAAIVVETGGVLGHVAAQARERGLPAVVDAAGASTAFREGDRVLVDGDAGLVVRIGS
jgi:phosphohistidine swiveling domain-containing protein